MPVTLCMLQLVTALPVLNGGHYRLYKTAPNNSADWVGSCVFLHFFKLLRGGRFWRLDTAIFGYL